MENGLFDQAIARVAAGDVGGLEEIYRAYASSVYAVCLSVTGQRADAEDAAVETFLRVWGKAGTYRRGSGHRAWLMTIAHHTAAEMMRRQSRAHPTPQRMLFWRRKPAAGCFWRARCENSVSRSGRWCPCI